MRHRTIEINGIETFYREAGPANAPVLLLPHGYPGSSFVYRHLMAELGDRWRLIAPDLPGFGYSATPPPPEFGYTFDAYADFLHQFTQTLELGRYVIWLHDYGSQFGLRLAMRDPDRVVALIIQNGDIYEDEFGPKYQPLRQFWANPAHSHDVASRPTSASRVFATSSQANSPRRSPTRSRRTCGRCTGR